MEIDDPEVCADLTGLLQPFVKEEILVTVFDVMITNCIFHDFAIDNTTDPQSHLISGNISVYCRPVFQ
jgi:hypothetical protein